MKEKLAPSLYVSTAPPQYMSKLQPNQHSPMATSVGVVVDHDIAPHPVKMVSFFVPNHNHIERTDNYVGALADECADLKASDYISCVRNRLRLEVINSE